jgi:glycosyltransferase involved in cell wall biosynthesis
MVKYPLKNKGMADLTRSKVIVIMPAYNAEATLESTYNDIPEGSVNEVILTDDFSTDRTVEIAEKLGIFVIRHSDNIGKKLSKGACRYINISATAFLQHLKILSWGRILVISIRVSGHTKGKC